jgi:hypothetical protein
VSAFGVAEVAAVAVIKPLFVLMLVVLVAVGALDQVIIFKPLVYLHKYK